MTLLVSERSLMIRTKFRSVLQLRLQHRRTREQLTEQGIMPPLKGPSAFYEQQSNLERTKSEDFLKHKMQNRQEESELVQMNISHDVAASPAQMRQKKARLADDLSEKILHRPGPLDLLEKNILPLNSGVKQTLKVGCVRLPEDSDPFPVEEDSSSSSNSASPEMPGERQLQGAAGARPQHTEQPRLGPFQTSAGLAGTEPIAGGPDPGNPLINSGHTSGQIMPILAMVPPVTRASKVQRQKRPKDTKPKVRKLKYHQYIPPDQKAEKSPVPMDAAYSRLLQQQQIFLQLQILNQQQQTFSFQTIQPGAPGIPPEQIIGFANTVPTQVPCIPLSPLTKSCQRVPSTPCVKPELLPANLDDLTVSELRQQLRKRGLPVSGTKPALLERLKPYQIFSPHVAAPPQPPAFESREANVEDVSLVEKERVIERLTWRLQQEQRQAEGLREELELRKRHQQQQGGTDAAPSSLGEVLPLSPSGDSYPHPSPLEGTTEDSKNSSQPRPLESHIGSNLPLHLGDGGYSGLLVPRAVELDFPYSPSSLQSFFTLEDTEVEAKKESSSDENFDSEVYLCDSLGSGAGVYDSLEALSTSDSGGFQSLEEELTEAIKSAELSQNQSIEDILEEHLLSSDSSPSIEQCFPESPSDSLGTSSDYLKEVGEKAEAGPATQKGASPAGQLLVGRPPYDVFEEVSALPGPVSPPLGGPGTGELSPVAFDPADWMDPLPEASPGGFPAEFLDAPDLNINRMIDLLVEQW